MVESVDTRDLKSLAPEGACGFKSHFEYTAQAKSAAGDVHRLADFATNRPVRIRALVLESVPLNVVERSAVKFLGKSATEGAYRSETAVRSEVTNAMSIHIVGGMEQLLCPLQAQLVNIVVKLTAFYFVDHT